MTELFRVSSSIPTAGNMLTDPIRVTVNTTAVPVIVANADRKSLTIVNGGTTVIKLAFGPVDPTQSVYMMALAACTSTDDGTGGALLDSEWNGEVRAISSAASGAVLVTEVKQ